MDRLLRTIDGTRRQDVPKGVLSRLAIGVWIVVGLCTTVTACARPEAAAPLGQTFESPEQLATAVAEALKQKDAVRLQALAITEAEFKALVWPHLPASRSEGAVPFGFVWTQLNRRSNAHLSSILTEYGGQQLEVAGVRFLGETTAYGAFDVHRKAVVVLKIPDGTERSVRLFGSILTQRSRHKLFSYVID